jgi:hypothetical protein
MQRLRSRVFALPYDYQSEEGAGMKEIVSYLVIWTVRYQDGSESSNKVLPSQEEAIDFINSMADSNRDLITFRLYPVTWGKEIKLEKVKIE